jgi:hypothetical protein
VFVGDPSVHRHAVASEPNTEVLAFGGEPGFEPAGDEWMWRVRPLLPEQLDRAREVADEGLVEAPGNPGVYYAQALIASADCRAQDAREWLANAVELEPRLLEEARAEDLLSEIAVTLEGSDLTSDAGRGLVRRLPAKDRALLDGRGSRPGVSVCRTNPYLGWERRDSVCAGDAVVHVALGNEQDPFPAGILPVKRVLTGICPACPE